MGLNPSKICENALKLAIRRLQGVNLNKCLVDEPGFEPGTSTMPTWRSCQTDLLAQIYLASESYPASFNKRFLWSQGNHQKTFLITIEVVLTQRN
jgi:hypothetical protein